MLDWIKNNKERLVCSSSNKKIAILACSDEQPFIDQFIKDIGYRYNVITAEVFRSSCNSGGLTIATNCDDQPTSPNYSSTDCIKYRSMAKESIHRGHPELSNYLKVEQAMLEAQLLAKCVAYFASQGNFSNSVRFINPTIECIRMNELDCK